MNYDADVAAIGAGPLKIRSENVPYCAVKACDQNRTGNIPNGRL